MYACVCVFIRYKDMLVMSALLCVCVCVCCGRYELYGRWKNRSYGVYPELMEARTQTLSQGRYIMK